MKMDAETAVRQHLREGKMEKFYKTETQTTVYSITLSFNGKVVHAEHINVRDALGICPVEIKLELQGKLREAIKANLQVDESEGRITLNWKSLPSAAFTVSTLIPLPLPSMYGSKVLKPSLTATLTASEVKARRATSTAGVTDAISAASNAASAAICGAVLKLL